MAFYVLALDVFCNVSFKYPSLENNINLDQFLRLFFELTNHFHLDLFPTYREQAHDKSPYLVRVSSIDIGSIGSSVILNRPWPFARLRVC